MGQPHSLMKMKVRSLEGKGRINLSITIRQRWRAGTSLAIRSDVFWVYCKRNSPQRPRTRRVPSFPHAFSGNPGETGTGPPIKTFGGDAFGLVVYVLIPGSLRRRNLITNRALWASAVP